MVRGLLGYSELFCKPESGKFSGNSWMRLKEFMLIFFTVQIFLYLKINIPVTFMPTSFDTGRTQMLRLIYSILWSGTW